MKTKTEDARLNQVRLLLPVIPGEPVVEIDGLALKGVLGAQLEHKPDAGTILHLTLLAHIDCETAVIPAEEQEEAEKASEWETIAEMTTLSEGEVVHQRHRTTGERRKLRKAELLE